MKPNNSPNNCEKKAEGNPFLVHIEHLLAAEGMETRLARWRNHQSFLPFGCTISERPSPSLTLYCFSFGCAAAVALSFSFPMIAVLYGCG